MLNIHFFKYIASYLTLHNLSPWILFSAYGQYIDLNSGINTAFPYLNTFSLLPISKQKGKQRLLTEKSKEERQITCVTLTTIINYFQIDHTNNPIS